jgi:hypothetical protein
MIDNPYKSTIVSNLSYDSRSHHLLQIATTICVYTVYDSVQTGAVVIIKGTVYWADDAEAQKQ